MTDGFNDAISTPADGFYRENKKFFTIAVTYKDRTKDKVFSTDDRNLDIQTFMKGILSIAENIESVRLINEPLGSTEHEYKREHGEIRYYGWSNCD